MDSEAWALKTVGKGWDKIKNIWKKDLKIKTNEYIVCISWGNRGLRMGCTLFRSFEHISIPVALKIWGLWEDPGQDSQLEGTDSNQKVWKKLNR